MKNFKMRYLAAVSVVAFTAVSVSAATTTTATSTPAHKIYVGVAAGAQMSQSKRNASFDDAQGGAPKPFTVQDNLSNQSFAGGVMLGYAYLIQNFLIGLEADVLFGESKESSNTTSNAAIAGRNSLSDNGGPRFGLATRFGMYVQNFLWYVRLGVEWQRQQMKVSPHQVAGTPISQLDVTQTKMAFVPGVGTEMKIDENNSVGLEYRASFYNSIKGSEAAPTPTDPPTVGSMKKTIHTMLLTYKYSFNVG